MTKKIVGILAGFCFALPVFAQASQPSRGDISAADSLLHSATNMLVLPGVRGRAGRLVALTDFARRLAPNNPQVNRLVANVIYADYQHSQTAAKAVKIYLQSYGRDREQGLLWLNLSMSLHQSAKARIASLTDISNLADLPKPLRSQASANCAHILMGQGLREDARKMFDRALELDPLNESAQAGRLATLKEIKPSDNARVLLAALKSNAGRVETVAEMAALLQSIGLHGEAVIFFRHVWNVEKKQTSLNRASYATSVQFANALLDAGQVQQAVEILEPLLKRFTGVYLRSLLAEAFTIMGEEDQARQQIKAIAAIYKPAQTASVLSDDMTRQLAMFFLLTKPDAEKAFRFAQQAFRSAPTDSVAQRLFGAAKIVSGKKKSIKAGLKQLEKLLDRDLYAAVLLAKYHFSVGEKNAATRAVLAGAKIGREGPAFRLLRELAKKNSVKIPPVDHSAEVAKLVKSFDQRYLDILTSPEKFVSVTIRPIRPNVKPGEPIEVELILKNISSIDVPLGKGSLPAATASLMVTVAGKNGKEIRFNDLPIAVWPAPRYLSAGKSVGCKVRLDVGKLEKYLVDRPMEQINLTVTCRLAPYQQNDKVRSALPGVKIASVRVVRDDILCKFDRRDIKNWPPMYQRTLGLIVRDMKRGNLNMRMRAARQVASLLAFVGQIERGADDPPRPLRGKVTKPVLITMLREVLKDSDQAVRAEMVSALINVPLDRHILKPLIQSAINDFGPLVRFRMIELIQTTQVGGMKAVITHLSKDNYDLVRQMARAFKKR